MKWFLSSENSATQSLNKNVLDSNVFFFSFEKIDQVKLKLVQVRFQTYRFVWQERKLFFKLFFKISFNVSLKNKDFKEIDKISNFSNFSLKIISMLASKT
jgi:hypothetical protein